DTMAGLVRDLIQTLGLGSGIDPYTMTPPQCPDDDVLCYFGGGSGTGWTAAADARNTGQGINPSSRPIAQADQDAAHGHMLEFITPVCEVAKDGIAILANQAGNGVLNKIKLTDIGNIFSCAQRADGTKIADTWEKIPGSDPSLAGLDIIKYTRDGVSGTT